MRSPRLMLSVGGGNSNEASQVSSKDTFSEPIWWSLHWIARVDAAAE